MALAAFLEHGALSDHHRLIKQFGAVPLMITSMAIPDQKHGRDNLPKPTFCTWTKGPKTTILKTQPMVDRGVYVTIFFNTNS